MTIQVRLFAAAKQIAGQEEVAFDLPEGATVADLRRAFHERFPDLGPLLSHTRFSINAQFAGDQDVLAPQDEIACIPPVSGG